jgi:hypothetical protein
MDSNPQEVTRMAGSTLTPADADAIGDAIIWLELYRREAVNTTGIAATKTRLEQLLADSNRA